MTSRKGKSGKKKKNTSDRRRVKKIRSKTNRGFKSRFKEFRSNNWQITLAGILLVGFILRILPISWGVPIDPFATRSHPDEIKVLKTVMEFPEIYWTTRPFAGYGTAIQYIVAILIAPFKSLIKSGSQNSQDVQVFYMYTSRIFGVLFSMVSLWLTYLLGKKLFDIKTATLATAFLAVSFFHTMNSSVFTLDVPLGMMLLINFWVCIRAFESDKLRDYLILGVCSGLLVGVKIVAGMFFAIPIFLLIWRNMHRENLSLNRANTVFRVLKFSTLYIITAFIIFALFHPHIFLDVAKYVEFFVTEKRDWVDRFAAEYVDLFKIFSERTTRALGVFVPVLGLFGIFTIPKKTRLYSFLVIFFIIFYYAFWRWSLAPRYVIPVAPYFCLFAASFCIWLTQTKYKLAKYFSFVLIIATLGHSIYWCSQGIDNRLNDSRVEASEFIVNNIPYNSTIGVSGVSERYPWTTHAWNYPKIFRNNYQVVNFFDRPQYLIINNDDYSKVLRNLRSGKVEGNFVLPEKYHREWYRYSAPTPKIFKFYDDLANNRTDYKLIKTIGKGIQAPLEFRSPVFRIYARNSK